MISARKYREGIPERFGLLDKGKLERLKGGPVVWVHAVSVGETNAVVPLLKSFKEKHPEAKVLFSTVTRTGNRVAASQGKGLVDALIYFPLDISWVVRRVVKMVGPCAFIVVEKEVWPNIFRTLNRSSIPIIVVNGTISDKSFKRFMRLKFFFRDVFGQISYFCARTDEDLVKAVKAGVREGSAEAVGNIKFDLKAPAASTEALESLKEALSIGPKDKVIVAGSTHRGEEEVILNAFKGLLKEIPGVRLILAPRHPERFGEVESIIKKSSLSCVRRTSGAGACADVVLLDTVGELLTVYSFATAAIVGGSLVEGIGGHNLLEPAYFSKPVIYGGYLTTYLAMAEMLEAAGAGVRVNGESELAGALKKILTDNGLRERSGASARKVVEENRGAIKRTVEIIERFLIVRTGKPRESV